MNTAQKLSNIARGKKLSKNTRWASHEMMRFIRTECELEAHKGYGSMYMDLCSDYDVLGIIQRIERSYSALFVIELIEKEGFEITLDKSINKYIITWDNTLKQSNKCIPNSFTIKN